MLEKYDGKLRKDKWYRMLCPFHSDRTPSLDVDVTKPGFRCWSCNETGNYIDLISKLERVSRITAEAIIAEYRPRKKSRGRLGRSQDFVNYLDKSEVLDKFSPISKNTITGEYLEKRKIDLRLAKKFLVKEGNALEKGWQNRVIFPIFDIEGNLCSIEGRDITNKSYLRYKKWTGSQSGIGIFGINMIPKKSYKKAMFICEGAIDVLSVWLSGYVALGLSCSSITSTQMRQLKRITECPMVLLDGVKTGTEEDRDVVFEKLNEQLSNKFKEYKVIEIPYEDTDPNDLHRKGKLKTFLRRELRGK